MQRVQNAAARAVLNTRGRVHSRKICKSLHWLPISHHIDYKIATLSYKIVKTEAPSYLCSYLSATKPSRSLRSGNNGPQFLVPFVKTEMASRAFSVYAPKLINSFPKNIRDMFSVVSSCETVSIKQFKRVLKTFLFKSAFADVV